MEPGPVTAEQALKKVSPPALAVVGIWMAGMPASAPAGAVAVRWNAPEPVFVQVPVTPPETEQVRPTTVVQGTRRGPTGTTAGRVRVGVGVRVSACAVAVRTTAVWVRGWIVGVAVA